MYDKSLSNRKWGGKNLRIQSWNTGKEWQRNEAQKGHKWRQKMRS